MFDVLIYLMLFLPFGFPVLPWLFARWGRNAVWLGTGLIVFTLFLFPFLFFAGCSASKCGQGAIAILVLAPVWAISGIFTMVCAGIVSRRRPEPDAG